MAAGAIVSLATDGLDDPKLLGEWFAIAWSREIEAGKLVARRLMGRDVVLWRAANGIHCWRDLCVHRGAKLSLGIVRNDCLVCPYHAWEYNSNGQCIHIPAHPGQPPPAKARTQTYHARERYGVVWVCIGEPTAEVPEFPYGDDSAFRLIHAGPYSFHAKGPRVIENLFDVAHLGFVHAGLLGDPEHGEIEDYEVAMGTHGPDASAIRIWQPNPDGTGKAALVTYHYWAAAILTAGIEKVLPSSADGSEAQRFGILCPVAPIDSDTCELRMVFAMDYGHDVPEEEIVSFQNRLTAQDKVIVESQRPELLPLDLQAELHLRSDRMAIAYRKWLRQIGLTYGTA